ncbi:MAG: hypothetical protein V4629_03315 [Pseudomonadota bacterium]
MESIYWTDDFNFVDMSTIISIKRRDGKIKKVNSCKKGITKPNYFGFQSVCYQINSKKYFINDDGFLQENQFGEEESGDIIEVSLPAI